MKHGSLFNGLGGFQLAAEWMDWENVFSSEIDDYCNRITKYHFPKCKQYGDIKTTDFSIYRGLIDLLTGGFPCQGFSNSGRKLGDQDERYLFKEMLRAVREIKPRWVVAENVRGLTSSKFKKVFNEICTSLEIEGYQVSLLLIPASAIGADHERYRIWIVANSECSGLQRQRALLGQLQPKEVKNWQASGFVNFIQRNAMPYVCGDHHGISRRMDEQALHAIGNAIHPGVAYEIFKTIEQYETSK